MSEYEKIQSIYKRDPATNYKTFTDEYSVGVFKALRRMKWVATEKVDGTNVRIYYNSAGYKDVSFKGRTSRAEIPSFLEEALLDLFPTEKFINVFGESSHTVILYGEGYGPKIQRVGVKYRDDHSFVLFDVKIGGIYLSRENVVDIAKKLGIDVVPTLGTGTLDDLEDLVRKGFNSAWGDFRAEGIVARPEVELQDRRGNRIITKIKCSDFDG